VFGRTGGRIQQGPGEKKAGPRPRGQGGGPKVQRFSGPEVGLGNVLKDPGGERDLGAAGGYGDMGDRTRKNKQKKVISPGQKRGKKKKGEKKKKNCDGGRFLSRIFVRDLGTGFGSFFGGFHPPRALAGGCRGSIPRGGGGGGGNAGRGSGSKQKRAPGKKGSGGRVPWLFTFQKAGFMGG